MVSFKDKKEDPVLRRVWNSLREEYFPDRPDLDEYQLVWSNRNQKRTLASCNLNKCKIRVAKEMNTPALQDWLSPLLYHEMCHAYLGRTVKRYHGHDFKRLESLHPQMSEFQSWVKTGGWQKAVRSDRSRQTQEKIRQRKKLIQANEDHRYPIASDSNLATKLILRTWSFFSKQNKSA